MSTDPTDPTNLTDPELDAEIAQLDRHRQRLDLLLTERERRVKLSRDHAAEQARLARVARWDAEHPGAIKGRTGWMLDPRTLAVRSPTDIGRMGDRGHMASWLEIHSPLDEFPPVAVGMLGRTTSCSWTGGPHTMCGAPMTRRGTRSLLRAHRSSAPATCRACKRASISPLSETP